MTKKWIDDGKLRWCWLEHGDAALMLQEFRKERLNSWKPEGKVGVGVFHLLHLRRRAGDLPRSHLTRNQGCQALRRKRHVGHVE